MILCEYCWINTIKYTFHSLFDWTEHALLWLLFWLFGDVLWLYVVEFHVCWVPWLIDHYRVLVLYDKELLLILCWLKWPNSKHHFHLILILWLHRAAWSQLPSCLSSHYYLAKSNSFQIKESPSIKVFFNSNKLSYVIKYACMTFFPFRIWNLTQ